METYLTVLEVATALRVNRQTVYRLVWTGELPRVNIGAGKTRPRFRIRQSAVEQWARGREKGGKAR